MNLLNSIDLNTIVTVVLTVIGIGLLLSLLLLGFVLWKVRRINLPPGADILTTLRATPLSVVIVLDLLDFSLDVLSAPISWVLLSRLGLAPLRGVTMVKDLIPFTQWLPAMTIGWIIARVMRPAPYYSTTRTIQRIPGRTMR
jgi:hypothetical protein